MNNMFLRDIVQCMIYQVNKKTNNVVELLWFGNNFNKLESKKAMVPYEFTNIGHWNKKEIIVLQFVPNCQIHLYRPIAT